MSNINCKELGKNIDDLKKNNDYISKNIDELENSKKKYEKAKIENDPKNGDSKINTQVLKKASDKASINEFKDEVKSLSKDDIAITEGGHLIDPRTAKDVDFDDYISNEQIPKGNQTKLVKAIDGFATGGILPEMFRTINEVIVNNANPYIKQLGYQIASPFRTADGKDYKNIIGSTQLKETMIRKDKGKLLDIDEKAAKAYKSNGGKLKFDKNHIFNDANWSKVYEDSTKYARGERDFSVFNHSDDAYIEMVKYISDEHTKIINEAYRKLKESGHDFGKDLDFFENYRTRLYKSEKIGELNSKATRESIVDSFETLIIEAQPWLKDMKKGRSKKNYSKIIADGMWKTISNNAHGLDEISNVLTTGITDKTLAAIREQLFINSKKSNDAKLVKEFDEMWGNLKKQLESGSDKKIMKLNENGTMKLIDKETGKEFTMRFDELLENDSRKLTESYINKTHAFTALGETAKRYNIPEMNDIDYYKNMKRKALEFENTADPEVQRVINEFFDFMEEEAFNRPHSNFNKKWQRFNQAFGSYVMATQLSKLALTMTIEEGKIMSMVGFKMWLKTLAKTEKSYKKILKEVVGNETDALDLLEAHDFLRGNLDVYAGFINQTVDSTGEFHKKGSNRIINGAETFVDKSGKVVSNVFGIRKYDKNIRTRTGLSIMQQMGSLSKKGKLLDFKTSDRWLSSFMDKADVQNLEKMFNKYGVYSKNGNLVGIDLKKWNVENPESLSLYTHSLEKMASHVILTPKFDALPLWMQNPQMKTIFMLRNFGLNEIQTIGKYHLHFRDKEAIQTLLYTAVMASVSTYAHIQVNAAGRKDREEYLEKELYSKKFFTNAANRLPGSVLWAPLVDIAYGITHDGDTLFSTSAKGGAGVDSIPIVGFANKVKDLASGKWDLKTAVSLVPVIGGSNPATRMILNQMADDY